MTDLLETWGQDMLDETAEELRRGHGFGAVSLGPKGDPVWRHLEQPGIGNADPVGVAPQVFQNPCR